MTPGGVRDLSDFLRGVAAAALVAHCRKSSMHYLSILTLTQNRMRMTVAASRIDIARHPSSNFLPARIPARLGLR